MAPLRMEVGPAQACAVKVVVHLPIKSSANWRFHARKESELSISLYNDEREGRTLRSIGLPFLSVGLLCREGESENDSSRTQSSKESSSHMVSLSAPLAAVEGSALPPTAAHIMGSNRGKAGLTR
ncbi:hypothetical protein DY000_02021692 [Brassica cretica]|uniref:Uncharacterized protein n=1 Tax=Brassica cretica TaxID=69181 RepID=A0ABQ7EEU0_BRACR|nr:hypothetical protein DY000_02021692 [Brassica cretica]